AEPELEVEPKSEPEVLADEVGTKVVLEEAKVKPVDQPAKVAPEPCVEEEAKETKEPEVETETEPTEAAKAELETAPAPEAEPEEKADEKKEEGDADQVNVNQRYPWPRGKHGLVRNYGFVKGNMLAR
ncbi:hypothetical protein Tco_1486468, partial [Tanacetum coccineum]